MMEALYFTLAAITLFFVSDRILDRIEVFACRRLEYRSLIFFALLLGLSLLSFTALRYFLAP